MKNSRLFFTAFLVVAAFVALDPAPAETRSREGLWKFHNVAHRGGVVSGYPENTLSAFRRAISLGVDAIEIDLRGTRDGEVVIIHDETLDRTTSGKGSVSDHTLAELKRLDAGGGERIPTYREALGLISGTGVKLLLDIKVSPVLDKRKVVELTEEFGVLDEVIVGVRTLRDLHEFQELSPQLVSLGFVASLADVDPFIEAGVDIVRLWPGWIREDQELVGRLHERGVPVWTTAGDAPPDELKGLVRAGVNGILCDLPEVMAEVLGK